jgi:hypothetical protein
VAALLCRYLLEDIVLKSMAGSSLMVVWRMSLALRSASFGRAYLLIYSPGVSCWDSLEVQWGLRLVGRFLVVVGFGGVAPSVVECLDGCGVRWLPSGVSSGPSLMLVYTMLIVCVTVIVSCSALPAVVFGRPCLVWWCGLFV